MVFVKKLFRSMMFFPVPYAEANYREHHSVNLQSFILIALQIGRNAVKRGKHLIEKECMPL